MEVCTIIIVFLILELLLSFRAFRARRFGFVSIPRVRV